MMSNPTTEFIASFHSLTGGTIGERRKNLFTLLQETQRSLQNKSEVLDFSLLHPKSCLEETFKVESLIYFRKTSDLLEVLKSENPILIAKVLSASSLILKETFKDINGEQLVKQIFPQLSFRTKLKLLNKLALCFTNTEQAEDFFEAVRQNYGFYLSSKLLPCCSGDFVVKTIKTNKIEVTPGQLLVITKKYPELTESIFEILNGYDGKIGIAEKYKTVFVYLMKRDVSLFLRVNEKYKPEFCLGHRATKRLVCTHKQSLIKNSNNIYKLLKKQQIIKNLKQDFDEFYFNLFPISLSKCKEDYNDLVSFLEYIPSDSGKVNLMLETFKTIHCSDLWDYPEFVTVKLIELMTPDERELWMQTHSKPSEISEGQWISFMKTEKSLPLLKERISLTGNVKQRGNILTFLVITCKVNKDMMALADVCRYVTAKHRNEPSTVRQSFLKTILSSFNLEKLVEEHWTHINELLQFGIVNNEYFPENADFLQAYIKYRLTKGLPVKEQLKRWVTHRWRRLTLGVPKYEKECLLMLHEMVPFGYEDYELNFGYIQYLERLCYWNKKHPEDQISLLPFTTAMNHLKLTLQKHSYYVLIEPVILHYIQSNITDTEKEELLTAFFGCNVLIMSGALLQWLLKHQPSRVLQNIDNIPKHLFKSGYLRMLPTILQFCKYYKHLGIPEKLCELYSKILNKTHHNDLQYSFNGYELANVIAILSRLMYPNDFLKLITPYYPTSLTVDVQSEDGKWMMKVQKAVAASLRNIIPPSLALDSVLHFSKGDHLRFVQKSLYSVVPNVSENKLPIFFNALSTRAVSVRKHSIFLSIKVSDKTQIYDIFKQLKSDKNSSIRKSLFKGCFNFFVNNPDDCSWELLKEKVRSLDVNDNEAFKILTKWKRIPPSYAGQYFSFTWGILEGLPDSKTVEESKCQILDGLSPAVTTKLPKEFFVAVTGKYLFKTKELNDFQTKIQAFTARFIIYCGFESEQEEHLQFIFTILKEFVMSSWYKPSSCSFARKSVFNFVKAFCADFLEKKCSSSDVLRQFMALWDGTLQPIDALEEYLYLQFTLLYSLQTTKLIAQELHAVYDKLLKTNGPVIVDTFCKSFKLFINRLLATEGEEKVEERRYDLMHDMIKNYGSVNYMTLIVFLLPDIVPTSPKLKLEYETIIKSLMKEEELFVQLYLQKYFRNIE